MSEKIVIVDKYDRESGIEEKILVHTKGILHRAYSILVFNANKDLLIQQRAKDKYHSGGLWSNTCCGHQRKNEELHEAANQRLMTEMGFQCSLKPVYKFHYLYAFENGIIENEIDHVFKGFYDGVIHPEPKEVQDYKWIGLKDLEKDMQNNDAKYTFWFKKIIKDKQKWFESI